MNIRYKVKTVSIEGDIVKLIIQRSDAVKEKDNFNPFDFDKMTKGEFDFDKVVQQSQKMAIKMFNQDSVTVPYDEWKNNKINPDDFINIELTKEK